VIGHRELQSRNCLRVGILSQCCAWELAQMKTVPMRHVSFIPTTTMAQPAACPHNIPSLTSAHPNLADCPGCASSIVHGDALDQSTITEAEVALTTVEVL